MSESKGKYIISSLQRKWKTKMVLSHFFMAFAATILLSTLLHKTVLMPVWYAFPLLILIFFFLIFALRQWKITDWHVSRFLNQHYPNLQESSHLVLKPVESLNFLQKLQAQKIEQVLVEIEEPKYFNKKFRFSIYALVIALVISVVLSRLPVFNNNISSVSPSRIAAPHSSAVPEKILPVISSVKIRIIPPAYTHKRLKEQTKFNLAVEEGAEVVWQLTTNVPVNFLKLMFNDKQVLDLRRVNKERITWTGRRTFIKSGFYRLAIGNKVSEYYKVEIIKDLPPVIRIQKPAQHTIIDFGMPEKVMLNVALSDDYGIKNTAVYSTISSGSGEAVKFKEQQLFFSNFKAGRIKYNLQKLVDLKALGMHPGDELYFYIRAVDNHNQEKKSDVFIVTLPDTAQLMSMEGMVNTIDLKPEYFRSERQIIIETEQLLKDKDTISVQEFNNRSNNLGIDQKLLRLRYGKFLGEESDTDVGGGHDHDEPGHNEAEDFGNTEKIIADYSHKHDNAEDATFFEPELKAQLKATLNEMWKAELQLRINKPQEALPFEYKALRLLKDLQQKSRVYVAKTGFKATPLQPEKRLSGELDKIIKPIHEQQVEKAKDGYEVSRKAAGLLGLLKTNKQVSAESIATLQQVSLQLYNKASEQPSLYLPALASMNRILTAVTNQKQPTVVDINISERGLQKLLSAAVKLPSSVRKASAGNLSSEYFKNLNKGNKK